MIEFDESKHKRDELGWFAKMSASELKERQTIDLNKQENLSSGAKSGALDSDGKDKERADKHAALMYETYRNVHSDVPVIAKVAGCTEREVKEIKEYVFNNLEFLPDFDQAQTWDRLRKGNPIEADIIFIKHELMEIEYWKQGYSYDDAHKLTEKVYNYNKAIQEYKNNGVFRKKQNNQGWA